MLWLGTMEKRHYLHTRSNLICITSSTVRSCRAHCGSPFRHSFPPIPEPQHEHTLANCTECAYPLYILGVEVMTTAVRQRVPFRFSEDDGQDGPILDDQGTCTRPMSHSTSFHVSLEQEEVLHNLRRTDQRSNAVYYVGLRVVIGLSLMM